MMNRGSLFVKQLNTVSKNISYSKNSFRNINTVNKIQKQIGQNKLFGFNATQSRFFSSKDEVIDAKVVGEESKPVEAADVTTPIGEDSAPKSEVPKEVLADNKEKTTGTAKKHEFQAETKKLLDIVARSLYTDKEVFIRELISNASDATEKVRHSMLVGKSISDPHLPLDINIYVDAQNKTITIQDHGIGMTEAELVKNLGSIGFSGSLEYIKNAKDKDLSSIIGQFGVGFYSSFMVGNKVTVYSKSHQPDSKGYCFVYDGSGEYKVSNADGVDRGTKIVIELNEKSEKFSQKELVEKIIQKYSNFVGFNIKLNGTQVNTMKPLWTMSKGEITEKEHKEFYQFISHAYDNPSMHLLFNTDSPISIRALFYIGEHSGERFGAGRMDLGLNLYSRKVLIQAKAKGIIPEWLRFVKGVVDSEDIPLNLSREHLQDSALIQRINTVLTKRILKWLDDEANKDPDKYVKFFNEFGDFLREGLFTDAPYREEIGKLLRFESSKLEPGRVTSLDEYISRMPPDQKDIYYVVVPNRGLAENSPYFESFKSKNTEVLFSYNTRFDDYALSALIDFKKKPLTSIESSKASKEAKEKDTDASSPRLTDDDSKDLIKYMQDILGKKVTGIKISERLRESPALIVEHESAAFRRMVKFVDPQRTPELPKQQLEINPKHDIILKLNSIREDKPNLAKMIVEQIFDDALIGAGLLDDSRPMIPRINRILSTALLTEKDVEPLPETGSSTSASSSSSSSTEKKEEAKEKKEKKPKKEKVTKTEEKKSETTTETPKTEETK